MIKLYEGNETYRVILQSTGQELLLTEHELEELQDSLELRKEIKALEKEIELWQDDYDKCQNTINELSENNDKLENYKFMYEKENIFYG